MGWRTYAAAGVLASLLLPAAPAAALDGYQPLFRFADPRIDESSGLVDLGSTMVTANDSGNPSDLYVVDPRTGRTVGITHFHTATVDVEALAPAGGNAVWVGDIGDNAEKRRTIALYRVPVAAGRRVDVHLRAYRLAYPDGRHDAESLFLDRSGRAYVVTKSFTGGGIYRAPYPLSSRKVNRLQKVGSVLELATDAAMLLDGRHVLVRGYGLAAVYTFPGFQRLGSFALPRQRQGEGVSIGPGGRIRISSEGLHQMVGELALPTVIRDRVSPPVSTPSATPTPSPTPSPPASPTPRRTTAPHEESAAGISRRWLLWSIPVVILVGAGGIGIALRRRGTP